MMVIAHRGPLRFDEIPLETVFPKDPQTVLSVENKTTVPAETLDAAIFDTFDMRSVFVSRIARKLAFELESVMPSASVKETSEEDKPTKIARLVVPPEVDAANEPDADAEHEVERATTPTYAQFDHLALQSVVPRPDSSPVVDIARAKGAERLSEDPAPDIAEVADEAPAGEETPDPSIDDEEQFSVYANFADAEPVRKQESLSDGDDEQYRAAVNLTRVATTAPDRKVNSYLVNPPDTVGEPLPLRDVIIYTLRNNPEIGIMRWRAEDARHAVRSAAALYYPTVDFNTGSGIETVDGQGASATDPLNRRQATLRISQRVFDFGRSSQNVKRAQALNQAQRLLQRDTVENILLQTTQAYLNLLAVNQLLGNAQNNVEAHEEIFRLVDLNFKGGNTAESEAKRAQTRLDRARTAELDFQNQRENAINNFRRITGLEPGVLSEPALDVSDAYKLTETQIDVILSFHPALQSILRDGNSLRHQLKSVRRAYLPEFNVEVLGRFQDNVLGNDQWNSEGRAMLVANWNLYDGGQAAAQARQLRARENENSQILRRQRNQLKEEAHNIISVLRTSNNKTAIIDEQVRSSQRVVELYFKQFDAGRRTLLELLDAQADLNEAIEESIANRYENLNASFASLRLQNTLTLSLATQLGFDVETIEASTISEGY